jgi:hypothetical protein
MLRQRLWARLDMVVGPLNADAPQFLQFRLHLLFQIKGGLRAHRLTAKILEQLPKALQSRFECISQFSFGRCVLRGIRAPKSCRR